MNTDSPHSRQQAASREAERWFIRLQSRDCTAADRLACRDWQAADPANAAAYARVEGIFHRSADLRGQPDFLAMAREARASTARRRRLRERLRWSMPLAAAAVLVVAIGIGWQLHDPAQPERSFATVVGERRTLTLDDGSSVLLDTDSAVTVRYSRKHRDLVLEHGQAQFTVAPAPQRPFVVQAGSGSVRAVGTQFQVRKRADNVQVVLMEGVVTVSALASGSGNAGDARTATLAPGEQLSFDSGPLWATRSVDLDEVAHGWTRGELMFKQRPLPELLEEMNRYTPIKLRLGDPSLQDLKVTAVFYDNNQAALIRALELGWSLRAERVSPDEIVLYRRD